MFKRFFPLLLLIFLFWCESVNAETFTNNNYMNWNLTTSNNQSLNSGTLPFYTTLLGRDYLNPRLYLKYTNYTSYSNYYYDLTLTLNYSGNICSTYDTQLGALTSSCNIYVDGSSNQTSDGCQVIVRNGCSSVTIKTTNLRSYDNGNFQFQFNTNSSAWQGSSDRIIVQVNSYTLDIVAKPDTSLSSQSLDNATNTIINNSNSNQQQTNERLDEIDDSVNNINDSINDSSTTQANSTGENWFSGFRVDSTRGFASIITAPIRLIQGILNGSDSCTPLNFNVSLRHNSTTQSNEVSLPCGSILWNNVPNTAVLLYYSTIFGLFAWFVLSDMYKFIDSIRDPDDKSEFIMKL